MTFEEILDAVIAMLQRRGRVTYSTLKRQFQLEEDALSDPKEELLFAHPQVRDEAGRGLVWVGDGRTAPLVDSPPASLQNLAPLAYTPPYLTEKILTSRSALEGERKQVTVLLADLKGSMELLADRDPEEARAILDPVLDRMMAAVHHYEGTVNQVMGDGIMALFGAPLAHEDHAVRACYAALRMQEAVQQYAVEVQRSHGVPLHIRVGLNAGEVVVRSIGSDLHMDYTAVGQTTHLAARMEQMAMPGSILIAPAVLGLVEGLVQVKALGAIPVRGLRDPVEVYEVTGAGVVRSRLQAAAARGLTRFVGRQHELETLQQALAQAQAGHGQVVALVGEAGVGKSRLFYEFGHSHRTQGWLVLESASVSYGKASPYFPVVDLLKRYCRIEERDDSRTIRAKVTGQILTLDEALQATIPAVLALLDALPADSPFLTLDPPQRRQRTLDGLKRLLMRESQVQPLLLVCEDLHWIDTETQALLDSLVESLPTAQLLLLVNYRPEYQHGWGNKTYYTQLRLDPLPPASAGELLQALLGDDPSLVPLKGLLIARTEGNPFFLEESVRALVETGVLVGERGAYRVAKPIESMQVPATVQAVLAARVDRLPPEEKRLLQTAAVIGTEVPFALLRAIVELSEEELRRGLGHLQAAEFLYETSLFPELEYTFKHALTHEVTYSGLLQERRRALHARIVEAIELRYADRLTEQAERLAQHAFRGEVWDKAVAYGRQAGTKALARSALREGVVCFEQALAALRHLPESRATQEQAIDLRFDLRPALWSLGEFRQTLDYLREAATLAEALDDQPRLGRVSAYMCRYFSDRGDHDGAVESGQHALAVAETLGDVALQVMAHHYLGIAYHLLGDHRRAMGLLRSNVESLAGDLLRERFGLVGLASVVSRDWLTRCLAELGAFSEGSAHAEEAVQIAEAVDHPNSLVHAYLGLGFLSLRQRGLSRAIPVLERCLELCRVYDIRLWFPEAAAALGCAYACAGRVTEALSLLERAEQRGATMGTMGGQSLRVGYVSEAYLLAGRMPEAVQLAGRALDLARAHQERGHEAWALRLLGEIAAQQAPAEIEQAEARYQQALTLAEELGMRPLQAHCHRGLGTLYVTAGQQEQARAALTTAIAMYRAMDMTFWLPQAEAALAQMEGR
jgi:class 3 adenylate cyclase/tetratricopeptide (TPR) repeat protein